MVSRRADSDVRAWVPPGRGKGGHVTPPGFRHKIFSHIITIAPRVEIQMQGAKFAGSVGHPMTKNAFSFRGASPP